MLVRSCVVSNIAVGDRFGTSNQALAEVSLGHDICFELRADATSKFSHKPLACLDLRVAVESLSGARAS